MKITQSIKAKLSSINKKLKAIGITIVATVLAVGGVYGEYRINPDVSIHTMKLTGYQYDQLKPQIVEIMRNRHKEQISLDQLLIWRDVAIHEIQKCGGWTFDHPKFIGGELDIEEINKKIEAGIKGCK